MEHLPCRGSPLYFHLPGNATCLPHQYIFFLIKRLLQRTASPRENRIHNFPPALSCHFLRCFQESNFLAKTGLFFSKLVLVFVSSASRGWPAGDVFLAFSYPFPFLFPPFSFFSFSFSSSFLFFFLLSQVSSPTRVSFSGRAGERPVLGAPALQCFPRGRQDKDDAGS